MKIREVLIEDDKVIADSGTETIDIKVKDWVTEMVIDFSLTNGASAVVDEPPQKAISKIELVDGGKTYWSLTGQEAVAAAAFDKGRMPPSWLCEAADSGQNIAIPLVFGRYLGDPLFGFDPTKLTNPQLKVTWAKASGHLADSLRLGVWAKVVEDVAAPAKILVWKTIESFTSTSSGDKRVDLPVDYPYRRLAIRAYKSDEIMENILTKFKMDCDVGKFIPFELDVPEFSDICRQMFGPFELRKYDTTPTATTHQAWMGGHVAAFAAVHLAAAMAQCWAAGCPYYLLSVYSHDGLEQTAEYCQVLVKGEFPECVWGYQFGRSDAEDTWFPAPSYGDIDLLLTQSVADAACSVLLQQPRTLP